MAKVNHLAHTLHTATLVCLDAMARLAGKTVGPNDPEPEALVDLRRAVEALPQVDRDPFTASNLAEIPRVLDGTSWHDAIGKQARDWSQRMTTILTQPQRRNNRKAQVMPSLVADAGMLKTYLLVEMNRLTKEQGADTEKQGQEPGGTNSAPGYESIPLAKHLEQSAERDVMPPALRTAFNRVLQSETTPQPEVIFALGSVLDEARLTYFIDEGIQGPNIPQSYARNLLYAAARHHRNRSNEAERARLGDDRHIQNLLTEIEQAPDRWLFVRDEIAKFANLVVPELAKRIPPNSSLAETDMREYVLSAAAWAEKCNVPYPALRKQLERLRKKNPDIGILNKPRGKGAPKYLYRGHHVLPIVAELKATIIT
jgi:hypothetical protein